jgi:hypothetical protein
MGLIHSTFIANAVEAISLSTPWRSISYLQTFDAFAARRAKDSSAARVVRLLDGYPNMVFAGDLCRQPPTRLIKSAPCKVSYQRHRYL